MSPAPLEPTPNDDQDRFYRPNVGIVLVNRDRKVWLGRRAGAHAARSWQFPQGGVDEGEDLEAAARRELQEETGVRSVELLARTNSWLRYDFPPNFKGSKAARGFKGQRQVWFALRFTGEDTEVDLHAHHEPEFDAWRWAEIDEAMHLVVPFKRDAYAKVIETFAPIVRG